MSQRRHRTPHHGGSAPATPGFNAVAPEWLSGCGAAKTTAPAIPAAESTLGSHPCVALSSAQVLPEWLTVTSSCNAFAVNGDYPITLCHPPGFSSFRLLPPGVLPSRRRRIKSRKQRSPEGTDGSSVSPCASVLEKAPLPFMRSHGIHNRNTVLAAIAAVFAQRRSPSPAASLSLRTKLPASSRPRPEYWSRK